MIKRSLKVALLVIVASSFLSFDLPAGWFKAGSKPNAYEMGIDAGAGKEGNNAATIKSKGKKTKGFGTLSKTVSQISFVEKG